MGSLSAAEVRMCFYGGSSFAQAVYSRLRWFFCLTGRAERNKAVTGPSVAAFIACGFVGGLAFDDVEAFGFSGIDGSF